MPVKRRRSKARPDELRAWRMMFTTGWDFFDDVDDLPRDRVAQIEAAREAWQRLGKRFMLTWQVTDARRLPWAYDEFGAP